MVSHNDFTYNCRIFDLVVTLNRLGVIGPFEISKHMNVISDALPAGVEFSFQYYKVYTIDGQEIKVYR